MCVSSGRPDRNIGTICGCGSGDSGCAECGVCRTCAGDEAYHGGAPGFMAGAAAAAAGSAAAAVGGADADMSAVRDFYLKNQGHELHKLPAHHPVYREKLRMRNIKLKMYANMHRRRR